MRLSDAIGSIIENPLKSLQLVSIVVFFICSLVTFLIWTFSSDIAVEEYQIALFIIGATVLFLVITLNHSGFSTVLGILILGAFIVPTEDLIRFALIATGSDRPIEELYARGETGSKSSSLIDLQDTRDRLEAYLDGLGNSIGDESSWDPERTLDGVVCFIALERVRTAAQRADTRNAAGLISELWLDGPEVLAGRYAGESNFPQDMAFLRSEGLVNYNYQEHGSAQLTFLGEAVYEYLERPDEYTPGLMLGQVNCADAPSVAPSISFSFPEFVWPPSPETGAVIDLGDQGAVDGSVDDVGQFAYYSFELTEASEIRIEVNGLLGFDPVTFLLDQSIYDEGGEDSVIDYNDDSLEVEPLGSLITGSLEPGTYLIAIRSFAGGPGRFNLTVRRD